MRPFLGLICFFILLDLVFVLLSSFPDQYPLAKLFGKDEDGDQQLNFLLAFALAAGLLVRERDEGTLNFLEALPVTRSRIFAAKAAIAMLVLWVLPLMDFVLRSWLYLWSRTSLETASQMPYLLRGAVLGAVSCFVYLGLSLSVSFFRRFALLVLGLLICAYLALAELRVPYIQLLNIFSLTDPPTLGNPWSIPWLKLTVQLGLGAACMGVAYWAFLMQGDSAQRLADAFAKKRSLRVLAGAGAVAGILLWIGLGAWFIAKFAPDDSGKVRFTPWPTARANTARYKFLFRENQAATARQLIDRADKVEDVVRTFLAAEPIKVIDADLTTTMPHTAGTAHWKKVNMRIWEHQDPETLAAILAHETTHVYLDHATDSRLSDAFQFTRFFHEGAATYVEHRFFQPADKLEESRRVAAAAYARGQHRFTELCDNAVLSRKRDPDLVYPLGEVWVAALVEKFGDSAPALLLKAFARPDAPKDLEGVALWQDTIQAAGFSLSAIDQTYIQLLKDTQAREGGFIERLPRLRGAASIRDSEVRIRAQYTGKRPGALLCRVRPDADTPSDHYIYCSEDEDDVFVTDEADVPDRTYWYQLGWHPAATSQSIWEDWVEVTR